MKRLSLIIATLLVSAFSLLGCANMSTGPSGAGWATLLDGSNLNSWISIGNANWRLNEGSAQAELGGGFLVSKNSYKDFQIYAEFWVDDEANSGIFIRCADPKVVTADNSYEVNIFDKRPDPSYGTGAIVNVSKISPMPKAGGRWNTYEITAKGSQLTVVLNGQRTADVQDSKFASGPIALQYAGGVVKFRKVQIRTL
jgi:predicted small secreted protein